MGTVIDIDCQHMRQQLEARRIRRLIDQKFGEHEDYGLIINLLDEYGPQTMVGVIRSTYDPAFAC